MNLSLNLNPNSSLNTTLNSYLNLKALLSLVYEQATVCAVFIALAYGVFAWLGWQKNCLTQAHTAATPTPRWQTVGLSVTALAHALLVVATLWIPYAKEMMDIHSSVVVLNLGFAQALSVAACIGVVLFIVESHWVAIDSLRPLALSLPTVAVLLVVWMPPVPVTLHGWTAAHVIVAIAAHGVALLACGHAVLLFALNRVLKKAASKGWMQIASQILTQHCPPLVVLEQLLIRLGVWVAGLLAATILLGMLGGVLRLDHKTVLTVCSLLVWLAVYWGYHSRSWRALTLCRMVWGATAVLLLAYIGSRFVLQALLHR